MPSEADAFIVDVRVGCVAVYLGPKRNCLSGVSESGDCLFYRGGEWQGSRGGWQVDPDHITLARYICDAANAQEPTDA